MEELRIGTTLQGGKYMIEETLGQGGFGITYKATFLSLHKTVAIKEFYCGEINYRQHNTVMAQSYNKNPAFEECKRKFVKEARRMANLKSSHLVSVTDIFVENNTCYYVMDYIKGGSLQDLITVKGKLREEEAVEIFNQVVDALDVVHNHNPALLHLDIKPSNILFNEHGKVFLVDFGASKQFSPQFGITTSSSLAYTKSFAPIELFSDNPQKIGPWTDYYSLGVTLYYMLTGKLPPNAFELIQGEVITYPSNISSKTQRLIKGLLQSDIKDRPASVNDINALLFNDKQRTSKWWALSASLILFLYMCNSASADADIKFSDLYVEPSFSVVFCMGSFYFFLRCWKQDLMMKCYKWKEWVVNCITILSVIILLIWIMDLIALGVQIGEASNFTNQLVVHWFLSISQLPCCLFFEYFYKKHR